MGSNTFYFLCTSKLNDLFVTMRKSNTHLASTSFPVHRRTNDLHPVKRCKIIKTCEYLEEIWEARMKKTGSRDT